jgi:hypothetical protein
MHCVLWLLYEKGRRGIGREGESERQVVEIVLGLGLVQYDVKGGNMDSSQLF